MVSVRYKTFVKLVQTGAVLSVVGLGFAFYALKGRGPGMDELPPSAWPTADPAALASSIPPSNPAPPTTPGKPANVDLDFSSIDKAALEFHHRQIPGGKIKDATKGFGYKISAYQDPGKTECNRLKIDLDRDNKWDEKWTFEGNDVKRQVAPLDDEKYIVEYRQTDGGWRRKR